MAMRCRAARTRVVYDLAKDPKEQTALPVSGHEESSQAVPPSQPSRCNLHREDGPAIELAGSKFPITAGILSKIQS